MKKSLILFAYVLKFSYLCALIWDIIRMKTNFGYVRVAAAVPHMRVADCQYNATEIKKQITEAQEEGVKVVCFPELSITGYTCADLFFTQQLQKDALAALEDICAYTRNLPIIVLVGAPLKVDNNLYNCAFVMTDGDVVGVVPKVNLPNTGEFYEKRWFSSGRDVLEHNVNSIRPRIPTIELWGNDVPFGIDLLFATKDYSFGIEICEDLWSPLPASTQLAIQGAEIIFNLSSSNCVTGKHQFRQRMITQQSARVHCGYVYTSSGIGESTTDIVFSGSTYIAENGDMLEVGDRFQMESSMIITEIDVERLRKYILKGTNEVVTLYRGNNDSFWYWKDYYSIDRKIIKVTIDDIKDHAYISRGGEPLEIGDIVVYMSGGYKSSITVDVGQVVEFKNARVTVRFNNGESSTSNIAPNNLLVVTEKKLRDKYDWIK